TPVSGERLVYHLPPGCTVRYAPDQPAASRPEKFSIQVPADTPLIVEGGGKVTLPAQSVQVVPGSSWGVFTIACTIPIALFVVGVFAANPVLPSPAYNAIIEKGGPTFPGHLFPFVFICIMCGAISGFHALVSSGTTPKMIDKESQVRPIGYGAMLMEGLVGVVALIAAASLDSKLYYDINIDLTRVPQYQKDVDRLT